MQTNMSAHAHEYDVVVVGGGPMGLATAYECAKAGYKRVLVLEQYHFFNHSGSSGDLVRMFRTMYTEKDLADLALKAHDAWKELERDSAETLIWMTGLLNFGDPNAPSGPEGTLLGPIPNLERHKMGYKKLTREEIMKEYPFANLPENYEGLYGELNGCINVPLMQRTLYRVALQYGAKTMQYAQVTKLTPIQGGGVTVSYIDTQNHSGPHTITTAKVAITGGAYVNHILRPSFGLELNLNIWEMVYSYFSVDSIPDGTFFPSMWFQFAEAAPDGQISNLFYGFPALPWGVPNTARIAIDAAVRQISDPDERMVSPSHDILQHSSEWVKMHIKGANPIPNFTGNCLQTNVCDNNFVLDFIPNNQDVVIFTAGWGMKFVPLVGKILTEMLTKGKTEYDTLIRDFKITRHGIIKQPPVARVPAGHSVFLGGKFAPKVFSQFGSHQTLMPAINYSRCGSSMPLTINTKQDVLNTVKAPNTKDKQDTQARVDRVSLIASLLRMHSPPAGSTTLSTQDIAQNVAQFPAIQVPKPASTHKIIKLQYKATLKDSPVMMSAKSDLTVGIVGGGIAGLYAALILKDLGIDYEVFEAHKTRWGGRIYTHHFEELKKTYTGVYDYVDLGAMRFPKLKTMERMFDLFKLLDLKLEPYKFSHNNNILYYNGVRKTRKEYTDESVPTEANPHPDPLHFAVKNGGGVPDDFVGLDDEILQKAFGEILEKLNTDFISGFKQLMNSDGLSTRAYITQIISNKYKMKAEDSVNVVNWLETLHTASGLYDEAFSESIMDALDFQDKQDGVDVEWFCITGGTEQVVKGIVDHKLDKSKLHLGQEIVKMSPSKGRLGVTLTIKDRAETKTFSHIISTVPLPILRQIDTDECDFGYHKRTAMRTLHYDHSTKVVLVFKTRWWQGPEGKGMQGGQSSTDLFIRTVVYPSQGINEKDAPGILLVSYSWAQDASRMGSICLRDDLVKRCLQCLATMHGISVEELTSQYLNMHTYVDWQREQFEDGAFALFGPGQFLTSFMGAVTPEVHGHLHFAGEALSVHHAWIVGSLNSAYRTVHEILVKEGLKDKIQHLYDKWGKIDRVEYGDVDLDTYIEKH